MTDFRTTMFSDGYYYTLTKEEVDEMSKRISDKVDILIKKQLEIADKKVKAMKENETKVTSASTDDLKNGHSYIWGVPNRGEEVAKLLYGNEDEVAELEYYNLQTFEDTDLLFYLNGKGKISSLDKNWDDSVIDFVTSNWTELHLAYTPKDKELVWCWDDDWMFNRGARFYDSINNSTFTCYDGSRGGCKYDNYAPYEGEYPQWAKDALKKLKD